MKNETNELFLKSEEEVCALDFALTDSIPSTR
jgi:hypothetical protein